MSDLVGNWILMEATASDENGEPLPPPYGPEPLGIASFAASGRMAATVSDGRATMPDGRARPCNFYTGDYSFDGTVLVTRVDAASGDPAIGSEQRREVDLRGDVMVLRPPPRPAGGRQELRRLAWRRIA